MRRGAEARPKAWPSAAEQALLACVFGELAAERLPRILKRVVHEFALLAALRREHFDAAAKPRGQHFFKQRAVLDRMREKDAARRRVLLIKLRKKGVEDFGLGQRRVGAGEVGAIAPVLIGAKEERFDAEASGVLGDGEDVGFFDAARIDPLRALNRRERRDAVAQPRRALKLQSLGGFGHFARQLFADVATFAGEEIPRLSHELGVILHGDFAGARARTAFDLIEQARTRAIVDRSFASRIAKERRAPAHSAPD